MADGASGGGRLDGVGDRLRLRLMSRRTFKARLWRVAALDLVFGWFWLIESEFSGSGSSLSWFAARKLEKKLIRRGWHRGGEKVGYSYCNSCCCAGNIKAINVYVKTRLT